MKKETSECRLVYEKNGYQIFESYSKAVYFIKKGISTKLTKINANEAHIITLYLVSCNKPFYLQDDFMSKVFWKFLSISMFLLFIFLALVEYLK